MANKKVVITQLIYLKENMEDEFNQFESLVIPFIKKYNGTLLLRHRLSPEQVIESKIEMPYEIHLVEFNSEEDFSRYMSNPDRQKFLHLKENAVRLAISYKGQQL